ncbi:MAG TPA: HAMP domain-containing sensor histidine kinase [Polyangiaceae bacterium]|nr:HAMP domain-containing sensor histidine kinase [Polyangiaceae bacterium]
MSLRAKMTGVVAAVTAVALGGTFAVISLSFNRMQQDHLDAELIAVARTEAQEAPTNGFDFSDRPGPAANDVGPLTKHGIIYDANGIVLGATEPFVPQAPALSAFKSPPQACFDFWYSGRHFRGVKVDIPAHPGKLLILAARRDDLDGDERFLHRAMILAFIAALMWVSAVTWWSFCKLTRNQARIAAVARRVAGGDMSARVALKRGDRETAQLGSDVDDMIEKLSSLMSSQQRFISQAAHELRSPLTKLYGELQLALRRDREKDDYRKAIAEALEATRKLKSLAEDLLALASVHGADRSERSEVLIAEAVAEACSLVDEIVSRELTVETGGPSCAALARRQDVVRLLRNLIENAVAHTPPNGRVSISWKLLAPRIHVDVADEGPGVPPQERDKVFDAFFRGGAARCSGGNGAGLGLAIARELARAHGGDVILRTDVESGACFRVNLPQWPGTEAAARSASAQHNQELGR